MSRVIRAILFDLGGTLWRPVTQAERERVLAEAGHRAVQILRAQGHSPVPDPVHLARAVVTAVGETEQQAALPTLVVPDGPSVFSHALEEFGLRLSPEACAPARAAFSAGMAAQRTLFSDALRTLETLQAAGLRLGVVSDQVWGEGSHLEIECSGLSSFFQSVVLSCEVGWAKPHPGIFQAAVSELEVNPEEAVMVGDNLQADVQGAQALGIIGVWARLSGERANPCIQPDATIERIGELVDLLPQLGTLAG